MNSKTDSAPEQESIRRWLDMMRRIEREENRSQAQVERWAKSLRLLNENHEKYSGQCVALDGDCLIVNGPTARGLFQAKAEGDAIPFVELVTRREPVPFIGPGFRELNSVLN